MWPFSARPSQERIPPSFSNSLENPSTPLSEPAEWLGEALGGGVTSSTGIRVNTTSAMRSAAVFRCVALKSGIVAALPLNVYERTPNGRKLANNHRLYPILHDEPNDLMSAFIWKELIEANLMLAGNHYSVIEYDNASRILGLLPIMPQAARVERINGRNRYTFFLSDGQEVLDQDEVVHVPGVGFDGIRGLSPIEWAGRQPIGISMAMDDFVGRMHANSVRPSGWIETPAGIKPEGLRRLRLEVENLYSGTSNTGRTLLLDSGTKWNSMGMSLQDAQTLESRHYQVLDIARLFGIPPHMIGEVDRTTSWGTGIEQQVIAFLKFCIDPDLTRIENELNRKLFKAPYYCEFNREAMTAMDAKTQAELFASGIQNAGYTPNEVRRMRNLPDLPGGDELYIQSATIPISKSGQSSGSGSPQPPEPKVPA